MSDVIHTPIEDNPVQQGWAMAFSDKFGNQHTLPPQNHRSADHFNGPLPTLPNHSGLVDRFDDTQYYTA